MSDLNTVMLNGRITADAELRYLDSGVAVCNLTIASNRRTKKGGEWVDKPIFIGTALWNKRAEALAPYITKGRKVSVKGELDMESWQGNDGSKRTRIVIFCEDFSFLESTGDRNKDRVESVQQVLGEMSEQAKEDAPF